MTADLDTLLTALYVLIDDHVIPPTRRRAGRPKQRFNLRAEKSSLFDGQVVGTASSS